MKLPHVLCLTSSLLMTSAAVSADTSDDVDHFGPYVGAGYGLLNVDGDDFDEEDNAYTLYVGKQVHQMFSIEGGYIDFGQYGNDSYNSELDGYTLGFKLGLPVHDAVTVFAKGGRLWWDAELNAATANGEVDGSDNFYGVGASFAVSQGWDLRLDYTRFDVEFERDEIGILAEIDDLDRKVDLASISVQYTF
ncbi:OmpA-like transmembrane region [Catenovulum agarivorans DS-2]|uniref:OmpA-like transmembrane region n=1 Tax=Catenovulum agarivorans DS-2 TaxID=1328313 RepID=W7QZT9_9ALTE|nr:porin family protein [Catenovulum agarivorans]EWH10865.1 OmpA-like transmembrane region [Catenovulum agarivorans DS-2]